MTPSMHRSAACRPVACRPQRCLTTHVVSAIVPQQAPTRGAPFIASVRAATAAVLVSASLLISSPAHAELNAAEYEAGGEFGVGTAQQWGEADISGKDFSGQDLRRSNFTSAEARKTNFKGANLQGSYFIKAIVPKANFSGANLSDVLMDRATMVEADLTDANLSRAVFVRSDLTKAVIFGADFSNALVDRAQQIALCRYADGVNSVTGVSTRASLGCGSMRKFRASSPSSPDGPQVSEDAKEAFRASMPQYRK